VKGQVKGLPEGRVKGLLKGHVLKTQNRSSSAIFTLSVSGLWTLNSGPPSPHHHSIDGRISAFRDVLCSAGRGVDFHISFPMTVMAKSSSPSSNKPVKTFRLRGVSASVFENQSEQNGVFHKVQIVRTYKDGDEFKSTPTFSRDDLPIVLTVAQRAWEFVLDAEAQARRSRENDEDVD